MNVSHFGWSRGPHPARVPIPDPFPGRETGHALHLRLLAPDAVAANDLCKAYIRPLAAFLACRYPDASAELHQTAAEDALLGYLRNPSLFDPTRLDLAAYLRMAARGDLLNLLRREGRTTSVEVEPADGNSSRGDPLSILLGRERADTARRRLDRVRASLSDGERAALDLMLAEERRTASFAEALDIGHLSLAEQEAVVKRTKDRIKKRIERGGSHDGPPDGDGRSSAA